MTKINKLYLHGFKSFAKKTEIVFGDNFNCVLGPNGSGKSNIMDALCFVLGKTSAKSLRADKSANLIYNGGKSKNPMKEAEVSIFFDNEKKTFPIDEKEVQIARILKNSGQSKYKINGKTVTRQQVVDLMSIAKINPDGYNIILQGDIVHFVEMSGTERRGIIEEIGGISTYEEKRQKSLRVLESVEEKLREVEIIMNERQTYLKELKKERDQALKFKDLDDKLKRNKATLIKINMDSKNENLQELEKKVQVHKESIDKTQKEIDELKKIIQEKKLELEAINKEVEEKGDKEQVAIQKEIEQLKIDHATNKTRLSNLDNELSRLKERTNQFNESLKDQNEKAKIYTNEKESLLKKLDSNKKDIDSINKKIEEFREKHNLEGASDKEKEIEDIEKLAEEKQQEIQKLREEEQNVLREKDRLEFQINSLDEKIEKVLSIEKENKKEIDKLKQMKLEFKKATVELNQNLNENSSLSSQIANARDKLLRGNEELSKLNAQRASITEKMAGGIAIEKILEQKNKIKGIYGTVSDLGFVKSEYSLALEVAAGNRIKSIVVEDDKTASECIRFLKDKKLGTATFLPLNKIKNVARNPEISRYVKTTGVKGLATDLITYDSKFEKVFSYVFGGAIVVDSLNVARNIGIGNIKMVTLDGDIAEVSGAMQGGFRQKSKGIGFQEKEVISKIESLEKDIQDSESILVTLERKKQTNEDSIDKLRELKANLEGDIIKTEKSLHLESDDLEASKKIKNEINENIRDFEKRVDEVQNKIGLANRELTDAKIKKQRLRDEVNALRNPRLLAELNTFEQKRQEIKEDNIKIESEIRNIEAQLSTTLSPELENLQKILKQHDKEAQDFKEEKKTLEETIKSQEKDIKEKEAKQKKFYEQFKGLFAKRDKVTTEITKHDGKVISLEELIRSAEQKANLVSLDIARIKAEIGGLEEEFKQFEEVEVYKDKSIDAIKREIAQFDRMVSDIGMVNMRALEIYDKVEEEYNKLLDKQKTLNVEREEVLVMMNEIEAKKKELFVKTFDVVNENFKKKFQTLSTKGDAFLAMDDEKDPFSGGVSINVRLTGKKFMDIRSLSGGEKTMTALALIFAIQDHEPSTFYILDEVDAALDKRNAEKLAELVRQYCNNAQYVIISHNDAVISEADNLYGVSMDEHAISKVVSLKL
ncbi:chromosome segregation protein SMC [Candidatus Woesearchaeota archaeon]|nr:MAG: chromosome segregation protein SMC [Candidatus Woesearchaeota archaeon]